MAGRKDYELLFRLNAQLGGGYVGTFGKAQAEFSRLGKEIQALHKLQADVSSYQKQQQALENTRTRLSNLERQHDLLQKEIKETEGSTAGLERESLKLEQRIKDTRDALERQDQKLKETGERLREAGVNTDNLAQKDGELTARIKELQAEQDKAAEGAGTFGGSFSGAMDLAKRALGAAGLALGLREVWEGLRECVSAAGNFEASMSNVEALSGATAAELSQLSALAKELGATTKFTALEAGDAMGYMAMAGWDAQEMLSGMDGVLQLAAAAGEDLAQVSDIVTDNLTAFGLTAADTAHFSDVLAAAAANSNTSVSIMGETFKNSAAIAGALGYSVDDVAVAVGLMANAGVKGSNAGTALKNTLNGLVSGVTLTGKALGDYQFTAVKADGTMKSFAETLDELRACFARMTEAERFENAQAIAGQRTYNGLLAILNATDAEYASLSGKIRNCAGAAEKMANIKLDNLNGQVTLMNSAWDAVKTTIGEAFAPAARYAAEVATEGLTAINNLLSDLLQSSASTIPAVEDLAAAARGLDEVLADAAGSFDTAQDSIQATGALADAYIGKLEELEAQQSRTAGTSQEADQAGRDYHNTLELLCRAVPELAAYIDLETDSIRGGTEALRAHTEAWQEESRRAAYQQYMNGLYEQYNGIMAEQAENEIHLAEAQTKRDLAQRSMNEAYARIQAQFGDKTDFWIDQYATGRTYRFDKETGTLIARYLELKDTYREHAVEARAYAMAIQEGTDALEEAQGAIDGAASALDGMQESVGVDTLQTYLSDTGLALAELGNQYEAAYNTAYTSMSGQFGLFETVAAAAETSVDQMIGALESQISYMDEYAENLRAAADLGLDESLLAQLSDGSVESAAYLKAIAEDGGKRIGELNAAFARISEGKEEFSSTVAELQTGLDTAMEEMAAGVGQAVADMDLGPEAMTSARATVEGFIEGADTMLPQVYAAYRRVQQAAADALGLDLGTFSFGSAGAPSAPSFGVQNLYRNAYASGTRNAAPGTALVGEQGPELVYFRGGERVVPAAETAAILAGGGGFAPNVQFNIHVEGNASPETVESLNRWGEDFAEHVLEVLADAQRNAARQGY